MNESLPWAWWHNDHQFTIFTGASFDAFHAISLGLRFPEQVKRILNVSGLTDTKGFLGGYHNETPAESSRFSSRTNTVAGIWIGFANRTSSPRWVATNIYYTKTANYRVNYG